MDRRGRTVWTRIDSAGPATALLVVVYVAVVSFLIALVAVPLALLLPTAVSMQVSWLSGRGLRLGEAWALVDPTMIVVVAGTVAILVGIAALVDLGRARRGGKRRRLLRHMGARIADSGECPATNHALYDISIAAGRATSPALYVLDDEAVNAGMLGESLERSSIVVTRGFARRVSEDDQRAVFAHLFARLRFERGNVLLLWAALIEPITRLNMLDRLSERYLARKSSGEVSFGCARALAKTALLFVVAVALGPLVLMLVLPMVLVVTFAALAASVADQMSYAVYADLAEFGDAEGMTLLKDPRDMLGALDRVLSENNEVPAARLASAMFFCWPGRVPPAAWDPERGRIDRLRELVGAEGQV
jgi:hypothetical protein